MRIMILALLLVGCAKSEDVKTAAAAPIIAPIEQPVAPTPTPDPTPAPVAAAKCASSPIGDWKNGPLTLVKLQLADTCHFRIPDCGTTYEIVSTIADPTFATSQAVTVRVTSYDFVQNGCLRPGADMACQIVVFRDNGLGRLVFSLSCADDNNGSPYSMGFFRP